MEPSRILLVVGLVFTVAANSAAKQSTPSLLLVVLHDQSAVPPAILDAARKAIDEVFRGAGVQIAWAGREEPEEMRAFLIRLLVRPRKPEWTPQRRLVMGVALASDHRQGVAMIHYESVVAAARRYGHPIQDLLAIAITHEMGHLLLPAPAHSTTWHHARGVGRRRPPPCAGRAAALR